MRSNHVLCPVYLSRLGMRDSDECECGEKGDIDHIFFECRQWIAQRKILMENLLKNKVEIPLNISNLLSLGKVNIYRELFSFIINCRLRL